MPLARIRCSLPQESAPLIERLKTLGYDVALAGEGTSPADRADLEIEIQCCAVEDALSRAEAFARRNSDARVFVAPGVLPGEQEQACEASGEVPEGGGQSLIRQFRDWQKILPAWSERVRKSSAAVSAAVSAAGMWASRPLRRRRDVLPTVDRKASATSAASFPLFRDAGLFAFMRLRRLLSTRVPLVWVPVFSAVVLGTWAALPSPRPSAPLSSRQSDSSGAMEQQVPFGPVVLESRQPVALQSVSSSPRPEEKKTAKPKPGGRATIRRVSYDDKELTDESDVVVRHYSRRQATQAKARPKRISDMD